MASYVVYFRRSPVIYVSIPGAAAAKFTLALDWILEERFIDGLCGRLSALVPFFGVLAGAPACSGVLARLGVPVLGLLPRLVTGVSGPSGWCSSDPLADSRRTLSAFVSTIDGLTRWV